MRERGAIVPPRCCAPPEVHLSPPRDVRGTLGGSRLFEQPRYAAEARHFLDFLEVEGPALLEIGFDHGRRLSHTAAAAPGWRIVGLEIRRHRVAQAQARAEREGHSHLLAWRADARTVLARVAPPGRFAVIEALFPDPWHDPAHRDKRTLVTPGFLEDAARALRPGGVLHLATDVARYAGHIEDLLLRCPWFAPDPAAARDRPAIEALSRREWSCARDDLPITRFWLRRQADLVDAEPTGQD